ncbi:hypothetical protein CP532_3191 [Ophiocordyceps camponoti-leonardi (nom. inval.)]|nr:hypothetical protein CP532_3191 [Ophiocordyceps camponoti-leonardi (nom. inval.)]
MVSSKPDGAPLPCGLTERHVDYFFHSWAPSFPILEEDIFRSRHRILLIEPAYVKQYHMIQFHLVFSITELSRKQPQYNRVEGCRWQWQDPLETKLVANNVEHLVCLILAMLFCIVAGDNDRLQCYKSLALGATQLLGVHGPKNKKNSVPNNLMSTLYILDCFTAASMGLPRLFGHLHVDSKIKEGEEVSCHHALLQASVCLAKVLETIYPLGMASRPSKETMTELASEIDDWYLKLPAKLKLHSLEDMSLNQETVTASRLVLTNQYIRWLIFLPAMEPSGLPRTPLFQATVTLSQVMADTSHWGLSFCINKSKTMTLLMAMLLFEAARIRQAKPEAVQTTDDDSPPWQQHHQGDKKETIKVPQTIAHRGDKIHARENSLPAFRSALRSRAHAIETDVRLSRDSVAVLAHDDGLARCFGREDGKRVADFEAEVLAGWGCVSLVEFLEWLVDGGGGGRLRDGEGEEESEEDRDWKRGMWVLLDIKMDDDPNLLLAAIARAFKTVKTSTPWEKRILLGCWNASTILAARHHLPSHALAHIGTSPSYARHFIPHLPSLSLNMAYTSIPFLPSPVLTSRPVFAWTVNSEQTMRWAIRHGAVDGVITDDPAAFRALCRRYELEVAGRLTPPPSPPLRRSLSRAWDWCRVLFWHKVVFLYRRFWLKRLDYLTGTKGRIDGTRI